MKYDDLFNGNKEEDQNEECRVDCRGCRSHCYYFMAQCKKALGDEAGYRAELENSLKGWIHAGEMDYWRVKALRELGRDAECAPLIAELREAIKELETPQPEVINAYAKFAGDNSAMERAAKAREKADFLRVLLHELATQKEL